MNLKDGGSRMFLFQKIEELMMTHHDARYAVGEFVMHEQANLHQYTITQIAEYTFTSKATVVRFAKTLGFVGWKEFMKAFIAEVRYQESHQGDINVNYPFKEGDTTREIIEKLKKLQMETIQDSADLMEDEVVEKATSYIVKAKNIVIFGLSPNVYLGELFRRKLVTIGKKVEIAHPGEQGIMARTLGKEDCAILITYSGNNAYAEPACHVNMMKKHQVPIIAITSGGDNFLRQQVDCVLTISSKERLYTKISNFATEQSISFILNILFANYFAQNYQYNSFFKVQSSKDLEQPRISALKELQDDIEI